MKKTFRFSAEITVSAVTEVVADSLAEAVEKVQERGAVLGGIGTGANIAEEWVVEEVDGEVQNIHESS